MIENYIYKDKDWGTASIKEFSNKPITIVKKMDCGDREVWKSNDEKISVFYFKNEGGRHGYFGKVFIDYGSKRESFDIPRQFIIR